MPHPGRVRIVEFLIEKLAAADIPDRSPHPAQLVVARRLVEGEPQCVHVSLVDRLANELCVHLVVAFGRCDGAAGRGHHGFAFRFLNDVANTSAFTARRPRRSPQLPGRTKARTQTAASQCSTITHRSTAYDPLRVGRSEEHTSELQSLMRISYAVFCLKKKN